MNIRLLSYLILIIAFFSSGLLADQVEMQNGDRLTGKVSSMSAFTVVFESDMLGRIMVPRKNISTLTFGPNASAAKPASGLPAVSPPTAPATFLSDTNAGLSGSLFGTTADTNVIRQIKEQMLAGNPAAAAKFDELAEGLFSGKINMGDLRREAKAASDQLRELKRENPEAVESLNAYLEVLDNFLKESNETPINKRATP